MVAPESRDELAWAMSALLADDKLVDRMGQAARERYEQLFSGSALGCAYANLYREVACAAGEEHRVTGVD